MEVKDKENKYIQAAIKDLVINRIVGDLAWKINDHLYKSIHGLSILELQSVTIEPLELDFMSLLREDLRPVRNDLKLFFPIILDKLKYRFLKCSITRENDKLICKWD